MPLNLVSKDLDPIVVEKHDMLGEKEKSMSTVSGAAEQESSEAEPK